MFLFVCAGYAYNTSNLPTRDIEGSTQPSFFPWIITFCLATLSLLLLIYSLTAGANHAKEDREQFPLKRIIAGIFLTIFYLTFLPKLGFLIANILLFGGLMILYGEGKLLKILIGSIAVPVIIFFLFRNLFQISLPLGLLGELL